MSNPWVHNAKVLWVCGDHAEVADSMNDKSYALCRDYVRLHKGELRFKGGKLVVVSMLDKEYKRV